MVIFDLTVINSMLGSEVCFVHRPSLKWITSVFEHHRWEYFFGFIDGFLVDLDKHGDLQFSILVEGDYYALADVDILMLA